MSKENSNYRKDIVLGIIINEYIKSINPISSAYIAKLYLKNLSPATIRNIMSELEEEGYLTHPHTSAGRVPTQSGYRYYVDNLMKEIQLLEDEKSRIKEEYALEKSNLEEVLDKTSQVISDITHYTSIISIDGRPDKLYCKGTRYVVEYPDSNDIQKIKSILCAIEEKEKILDIINQAIEEKIKIYIGYEMSCVDINTCSLAVSRYQAKSGLSGRIAVLGPTRMNYGKVVSALDYFSQLMEDIL